MKDEISFLAKRLAISVLYFPLWWFLDVSIWFFALLKRILLYIIDRWALDTTLRLLFKPLYQDYTVIGIVIGPIIRFIKLVAGFLVLVIYGLVLSGAYLIWLVLPITFPLFASSGGDLNYLYLSLFFVLTFIFYLSQRFFRPPRRLSFALKEPVLAMTLPSRRLYFTTQTALSFLSKFSRDPVGHKILCRLGITDDVLKSLLDEGFVSENFDKPTMLQLSSREALSQEEPYITPGHLLFALIESSPQLFEWLRKMGCDLANVRAVNTWLLQEEMYLKPPTILNSNYRVRRRGGVNRSWSARPTPQLNLYSHDLTLEIQRGVHPPIVAKEKVIDEILNILSRFSGSNPLIVGEAGSGKSTLLKGLAEEIIDGDTPKVLRDKRVVVLDTSLLLAGMKTRGEIEARMSTVLTEVEQAGNIILVIEEMHTLINSGEQAELSPIFSALETHLESTRFHCLGTTTLASYRRYVEPNPAFSRHFSLVELPEATEEQTLELLKYSVFELERSHKVLISYPALMEAIRLADRLIHDRVFPDKALDILEQALSSFDGRLLLPEDISKATSARIHVPLGVISPQESSSLLSLERKLHERVIGQKEAVKAVADILRRSRVGLGDGKRPLGSLLLVGPTGVGKTEIARVLAQVYFGSLEAMIRLDMSEYQDPVSAQRLIGSSVQQGNLEGYLTEAVRRRPYSLILLDELEKADSHVLDLFLQVLEDGRLTSGSGVTVDFSNCLIIATSNVGAEYLIKAVGQGLLVEGLKEKLNGLLNQEFRPEFLNRFDGIVYLKALTPRELEEIAVLMLSTLSRTLMEKHDISLVFNQDFVTKLARESYQPELGARPLRRLMQDGVEARLAQMILKGDVKREGVINLTPDLV